MIDVSLINRIFLSIVQQYIRSLPDNEGKYNVVNDLDDIDNNKLKDTCGSYVIDIDKITCTLSDGFCNTVEVEGKVGRHSYVHRGSQIKPDFLFCNTINGTVESSQYKGSASIEFDDEVEIEKEKQDDGCYYSILTNAFNGYISYKYLKDMSDEYVETVKYCFTDEDIERVVTIHEPTAD